MTTKELIEKIKEIDPDGNFIVTYIKGALLDKDGLPTVQTEVTDIGAFASSDEKPATIVLF